MDKISSSMGMSDLESGYEADSGGKEASDRNDDKMINDESLSLLEEEILQKIEAPGPVVTNTSIEKSEVMTIREDGIPQAVSRQTPLPRIKSQIIVRGNTMIIYGGILEVGDREVTLDDIWSIELHKREEWVCIHEGNMHKQVWKGVTSDDEKSYISTDAGTGGNDSDDEDDDFDDFDDVLEEELDSEAEAAAKAARKAERKLARKEAKKGMREEIKILNEKLNSGDPDGTPTVGEELADFYSRTAEYWGTQAVNASSASAATSSVEPMSVKDLKREGFNLARIRYEELKPILDRLSELDVTQDDDKKRKKSAKKEKKKEKKKDRRK